MRENEKVGLKDLRWTVAVPVVLWWVMVVMIVTGLVVSFVKTVVFGG